MGYNIIMKFVLALLGSALAGECEWDDTEEIYVDADDCTLPSCDGDLETPHKGCEPEDCTAKDTPYEGCTAAECVADDDGEKYDDEKPYKGCVMPECDGDDDLEGCVEAETVYCEFDEEKGAPAFV